ncbi:MAG: glycosyltransferase [Elusimicrobiales bacterium]
MKILILNETLNLGGAETLAVELVNGLSAAGSNEVLFAAADGPLRDRLSPEIKFYPIPLYSPYRVFAIIRSLEKIIDEIKPDIIHSQGATVGVLAGFAAKRVHSRAKVILTHHSNSAERLPDFLSTLLFKKYCDFFVAIYREKYEALLRSGIQETKLALVPNFIDLSSVKQIVRGIDTARLKNELGIQEGSFVLVTAGRLIPDKRFDAFIKIVALCAEKSGKRFTGIILGEGEARPELEASAAKMPLNAEIMLLGYQKEVLKFLSLADVFVFPSRAEMLPMSLLEASAVGLPVVCSDIPGNREIVNHGFNGFVVKGPEADYCDAVLRVVNDAELAAKMRVNAEKIITEKFEKSVVLKKFMQLYSRLAVPGPGDEL